MNKTETYRPILKKEVGPDEEMQEAVKSAKLTKKYKKILRKV